MKEVSGKGQSRLGLLVFGIVAVMGILAMVWFVGREKADENNWRPEQFIAPAPEKPAPLMVPTGRQESATWHLVNIQQTR